MIGRFFLALRNNSNENQDSFLIIIAHHHILKLDVFLSVLTSWFKDSTYPGQPSSVTGGGDSDRGKLLLPDEDQRWAGRAHTCEFELSFGICVDRDHLGLASQSHPGSHYRNTSHTLDFSMHDMAFTHTAAAVLTGTTLGAHTLTFGYWEQETWPQANNAP